MYSSLPWIMSTLSSLLNSETAYDISLSKLDIEDVAWRVLQAWAGMSTVGITLEGAADARSMQIFFDKGGW